MTTKQSSTSKQINEYVLKRWAEAEAVKQFISCPDLKIPHYHDEDDKCHKYPRGRKFFASLPIDDEEAFYAHLFEIAGVAHSNKRFEWFNAILKAPIGDLLLAYWQMGNK